MTTNTVSQKTRRSFLRTAVVGGGTLAAFGTQWTAAPTGQQPDPILTFLRDEVQRLHADVKARGAVTGEHLRTVARSLRLLQAQGPAYHADAAVKRHVAGRLRREGDAFLNADLRGAARRSYQQHFGEEAPFTGPDTNDRRVTEWVTAHLQRGGLTPVLTYLANASERIARLVDERMRQTGESPIARLIQALDQEPPVDGTGGGGAPSCASVRAAVAAAAATAAVACGIGLAVPFYGEVACASASVAFALITATALYLGCA